MKNREMVIRIQLPRVLRKRWLTVGGVGVLLAGAVAYAAVTWPANHTSGTRISSSDIDGYLNDLNTRVAALQQASYKTVSNSGNVLITGTGNADILTTSFTPTGSGVVQVSATGVLAYYLHTNSTNQVPDRAHCCLITSTGTACHDVDIAATWPSEGGGSSGTNVAFTISYGFPYAGTGAFSAKLNCAVPAGFAPPLNGGNNSYGYVTGSSMTAAFTPAQAM